MTDDDDMATTDSIDERRRQRDERRARRSRRRSRHQGPVATILLVIAGVLIVLAGPVAYVGGLIRDEGNFVELTDDLVGDTTIRQEIASQTADLVVETVSNNNLIQSLPKPAQAAATEAATNGVATMTEKAGQFLDAPAVVSARDTALRAVHRQLTADTPGITIDLTDTVVAITDNVVPSQIATLVDTQVRTNQTAVFTLVEPDSSAAQILDIARKVPSISRWLFVIWLALVGAAIFFSRRRRQTVLTSGVVVIGATVATVVAMLYVVNRSASALQQGTIVGAAGRIVVTDYAWSLIWTLIIGLALVIVGAVLPRQSRQSRH